MKPVILIAAIALTGCGSSAGLKPADGAPLPVAPYGEDARPAASELLTPPPQTRPRRDDELLKDSHERAPDPFDLPPEN
ncbi:hypothetical protein DFR49_2779 [Hephaestia caeni]|uniref:Uncharacterized protein n=1 Tax=Hephaestia caeni TaxID=645617 RepID=A0A397PEG3_9SPHN|nr:hypothetical protein [Hephaestia caeni]RIA44534.1 hypothetical protein DFR49_2779 [Hephaestia caeni]